MPKFKTTATSIDGLFVIEPLDAGAPLTPEIHEEILKTVGSDQNFVDTQSFDHLRGTMCGLHLQPKLFQAKLIYATAGRVMNVAVDMRGESKTFGAAHGVLLTPENGRMLYVPPRFANGYLTLEDDNCVQILYTTPYDPTTEQGIIWDDQTLVIDWQFERHEIDPKRLKISDRDKRANYFRFYNPNALWAKIKKAIPRPIPRPSKK